MTSGKNNDNYTLDMNNGLKKVIIYHILQKISINNN
jgi:hypothetical protein